ncbi:MAG: hypothetical protein ACOYOF_14550 [Verrucomicrobiaceae bacterium]
MTRLLPNPFRVSVTEGETRNSLPPAMCNERRQSGVASRQYGLYGENGWKALVEIVADHSTGGCLDYTLQVVATLSQDHRFSPPSVGSQFSASQKTTGFYLGMWSLEPLAL